MLKLFTFQFYKLHVAFFLAMFIFFFGIVSPGTLLIYHLSIIQSAINSFYILAGIMACWFLYNLMCVRFFERIIVQYKETFLFELEAVERRVLFFILALCHALVFMPVIIYALMMAGIAFTQGRFLVTFTIIAFLFAVAQYSCCRILRSLERQAPAKRYFLFGKPVGRGWTTGFFFYPVRYILQERIISVIVLKLFSFVLFFLLLIRLSDDFDKNSFLLILLLIGYFHSVLLYHVHKFVEEKCFFIRNLPVAMYKRMALFSIPVCLVYIPELLFMFAQGSKHLAVSEMVELYYVMVCQLVFYTAFLYFSSFQLGIYLRWIFAIAFLSIFLYRLVDVWLLASIQLLLSYIIFKIRYFRYEHVVYTN